MSKFCGVCDQDIGVLTWSEHNTTSTHLKNIKQKENTIELETEGNKEIITQHDVLSVFSRCGPIIKISLFSKPAASKSYGLVEFASSEGAQDALSQKYYCIRGTLLKVSRWQTEKQKASDEELLNKEKTFIELQHKQYQGDLLKYIKEGVATEDQIRRLAWITEILPSDKAKSDELREELQNIIRKYIPESQVFIVGAYGNGFGSREATIDYEVSLPRNAKRPDPILMSRAPPLPDNWVRYTHGVIQHGFVTYKSILDCRPWELVWLMFEILHKSPLVNKISQMRLTEVNTIQKDKKNAVLFRHRKLATNCRITVHKGPSMNFRVTNLMRILGELDDRVKPLYMAIRFWAHQIGILDCFTSYGLFLLVYVYLENTKPPVLPSVETLAKLCDTAHKLFIDGWDVSFSQDIPRIRLQCLCPQNTQTAPELLQGFFRFYTKFDMSNRVFCPRTGKSYNMLKFRNMKKLFDDVKPFSLADKKFHIQDIFATSNSVTSTSSNDMKSRVCSEFMRVATLCSRSKPGPQWNLLSIIPEEVVKVQLGGQQRAPIVIPFDAAYLPEGFLGYQSYTEAEGQWYQWVVEMVMRLLKILRVEYALAGDYGLDEEEGSSKRPSTESRDGKRHKSNIKDKVSDFSIKYSPEWEVIQKSQLHCRDEIHLWRRGRSRRPSVKKGDPFKREETISETQLSKPPKMALSPFEYFLTVKHVKTSNESQIEITGEAACLTGFFVPFMDFFQEYATRIISGELGLHLAINPLV